MKATFVIVLSVIGCLNAGAQESRYTSTARAESVSFEEYRGDGPRGFRAVFQGLGGYQLELLDGDDRSWINLIYRGETVDLQSETMAAGPGLFTNKANDVVEWRGLRHGDHFVPYAIIYRRSGLTKDDGHTCETNLVVIKLDGERSEVIGHAEGTDQEAKAHAIADQVRPR
ncbi:MAG: hypothetical protein M3R59_04275 [Verrucomicrobiota bacterium]|nr:hypothetical protein [Verrucomicrobiota bacterium]